MNLSKEKQNKLLILVAVTAVVLGGLWFFLVRSAQLRLIQVSNAGKDTAQKIVSKKQIIQRADQIKAELQKESQKLQSIEDQMVTGDPYLWGIKALRDFEIPGQIEFTKIDPPLMVESIDTPNLSYKVASFVILGTASYHNLGTFLANFENSYPHIRINRLEMEPSSLGTGSDERLSFLVEMLVLVKPASAPSGTKPGKR